MLDAWLTALLHLLALPRYGLSTVFVVAFISATLLPLGSEPAVFGLVKLNPELLWPTIVVATLGNTMGGAVDWWMGYGAERLAHRATPTGHHGRALRWLERLGPRACLLSWLPGVGDPLCAVAGWLRLPFWPCLAYMAIGKFTRYVLMTLFLLKAFPQHWAL
jgi:membrane protein YqaA with SNARE-associated domain